MRQNLWRDADMAFDLITYMNQTMVNPHFELSKRFNAACLVLEKLFDASKS